MGDEAEVQTAYSTASVWPESLVWQEALVWHNKQGEFVDAVSHPLGVCIPCGQTLQCRPCKKGRSRTCVVKLNGAQRCHHDDHRLQTRLGKRERITEAQGCGNLVAAASPSLSSSTAGNQDLDMVTPWEPLHVWIPEPQSSVKCSIGSIVRSGEPSNPRHDSTPESSMSMEGLVNTTGLANTTGTVADLSQRSEHLASRAWKTSDPVGILGQSAGLKGAIGNRTSSTPSFILTRHLGHLQSSSDVNSLPRCFDCLDMMVKNIATFASQCLASRFPSVGKSAGKSDSPMRVVQASTISREQAVKCVEGLWKQTSVMDIPGLLNANTVSLPSQAEMFDERFERNIWTSLAAYHHCPHIEIASGYKQSMGNCGEDGDLTDKWQSRVELCIANSLRPIQIQGLPMTCPVDAYKSAVREGLIQAYHLGFRPAHLLAARAAAIEFHCVSWQRILREFHADHIDLQREVPLPQQHELWGFWQQEFGNVVLATHKDLKKCMEVKRQDKLISRYSLQLSRTDTHEIHGRRPLCEDIALLQKYQSSVTHAAQDSCAIVVRGPVTFSAMGARNWAIQWMMEALLQARLVPPDQETLALMSLDHASFTSQMSGTPPIWCQLVQ